MSVIPRRRVFYAGVAATVVVGLSLGIAIATRLQNKVLAERVQTLTGQLKQERSVVHPAPVGSATDNTKTAKQDFFPTIFSICQNETYDAQKQTETCKEELTETTKERDSAKEDLASARAELKQCKRDTWITLAVFRRLKERLGQTKQE